tara:strand:+ start:3254 stop:3409 length:156 start_codon:yes stop_codon:yes gene_type:complete
MLQNLNEPYYRLAKKPNFLKLFQIEIKEELLGTWRLASAQKIYFTTSLSNH